MICEAKAVVRADFSLQSWSRRSFFEAECSPHHFVILYIDWPGVIVFSRRSAICCFTWDNILMRVLAKDMKNLDILHQFQGFAHTRILRISSTWVGSCKIFDLACLQRKRNSFQLMLLVLRSACNVQAIRVWPWRHLVRIMPWLRMDSPFFKSCKSHSHMSRPLERHNTQGPQRMQTYLQETLPCWYLVSLAARKFVRHEQPTQQGSPSSSHNTFPVITINAHHMASCIELSMSDINVAFDAIVCACKWQDKQQLWWAW